MHPPTCQNCVLEPTRPRLGIPFSCRFLLVNSQAHAGGPRACPLKRARLQYVGGRTGPRHSRPAAAPSNRSWRPAALACGNPGPSALGRRALTGGAPLARALQCDHPREPPPPVQGLFYLWRQASGIGPSLASKIIFSVMPCTCRCLCLASGGASPPARVLPPTT